MRWAKLLGTVVLLFGPCCFGQTPAGVAAKRAPQPNAAYSIVVEAPPGPVTLASPINIIVKVTNISGKEAGWRSESPDTAYRNFRYSLTRNGREVATTFYHRKITGRQRPDDPLEVASGSSITSMVLPGESFSFTIDLKKLYQITEPGTYTLDVSRFDDSSVPPLRAKTLTLDIVSR
jgi:hypothetical protein